jgi:hypothetical protein
MSLVRLLIWNLICHCTIYLSVHYHVSTITTIAIIFISIFLAAASWDSYTLNIYNMPQNFAVYCCEVNDTAVCKVTSNSCWYLGITHRAFARCNWIKPLGIYLCAWLLLQLQIQNRYMHFSNMVIFLYLSNKSEFGNSLCWFVQFSWV